MMRVKVTNKTEYPTAEVRRLVKRTLKDIECDHVEVTVKHRNDEHATGRYRPYWYPERGERAEQITVALPRPGVAIHDYDPYDRSREQGKAFPLATWQEALVAIAAHEGQHHKQTPRNRYGAVKRRGRFVEVECDLAAYRAWKRFTS